MEAYLPAPELIWGLLPRLLGLMLLVAHGSLISQLVGGIGENGNFPVGPRLQRMRRDFGPVQRIMRMPTLFWLSSSDWMIRLVPCLGALGGLAAMYGGEIGWWGLLVGYICFLSVEQVALTVFPWDTMLLEVTFLGLFLPASLPLPELAAASVPLPTVAFMFRWLAIRLMWGFAKVKFVGTKPGDEMYLKGFMIWMPVPNPLGWHAHHAPDLFLKFSLYFMFVAEVIMPGLAWFTGVPRLIAALGLIGLMLGIQASGNWGFFQLGYIALCLCLLDTNASIFDVANDYPAMLWGSTEVLLVNLALLVMFLVSLFYFAMNSWCTRSCMQWSYDDVIARAPWFRHVIGFLRVLAPFRIVSGYGVFPPTSTSAIRMTPVFEGSDDGKNWQEFSYKFLPTKETDVPPVVAPHHPRIDHAVQYALSTTDASLLCNLVGDGSDYLSYTRYSWLDRMCQNILKGHPEARALFKNAPFGQQPPKLMRVSIYALKPTTIAERKATGRWWNRRRVGGLVHATGLRPDIDRHWLPEPELFHPDFVDAKRAARPMRAMLEAARSDMDLDQAVLVGTGDLAPADVEAFWNRFVPFVHAQRGDWARIQARVVQLRETFHADELRTFERLLERYALIIRGRVAPHAYGKAEPAIALESSFRLHLLTEELVMDGREAYRAMWADTSAIAERHARRTKESELYTLALLRWETIDFHIRTFRWVELVQVVNKLRFVPGISEFFDLLAAQQPTDEQWVPCELPVPKTADLTAVGVKV